MKNNKSYLLVSESFGVGHIIEIHNNEILARKRIQRFFDLQYNQIDPSVDVNAEYTSLRNYRYREDTYFEDSRSIFFMQSNGFNSVYIIQIDFDKGIDEIINDFILLRNE